MVGQLEEKEVKGAALVSWDLLTIVQEQVHEQALSVYEVENRMVKLAEMDVYTSTYMRLRRSWSP